MLVISGMKPAAANHMYKHHTSNIQVVVQYTVALREKMFFELFTFEKHL